MALDDNNRHVQATCAVTGEGLYEGLGMMAEYARNFKRQPNLAL